MRADTCWKHGCACKLGTGYSSGLAAKGLEARGAAEVLAIKLGVTAAAGGEDWQRRVALDVAAAMASGAFKLFWRLLQAAGKHVVAELAKGEILVALAAPGMFGTGTNGDLASVVPQHSLSASAKAAVPAESVEWVALVGAAALVLHAGPQSGRT